MAITRRQQQCGVAVLILGIDLRAVRNQPIDGRGLTLLRRFVKCSSTITIRRINGGAGSHGISFAAGGRLLLVTNTGTSTVSVIDAERDEVVKTVPVRGGPEGIAYKRP